MPHKHSIANSQSSFIGATDTNKNNNTFSVDIPRLRSHDQSFSKLCVFSPHDTDTVVVSNLSTLESIFKSLRFHRFRVDGT